MNDVERQHAKVRTTQAWRSNRELVNYVEMKRDATDLERLLAERLRALLP